ncbi:MAG: CPBP family intramembrane glutamic endopeptidase [Pseudomonadota bacterium]
MSLLSTDSLTLFDLVLLAYIVAIEPIRAFLKADAGRAKLASSDPNVRVETYTRTILHLWAIAMPILILWAVNDREWHDLGFQIEATWVAATGWAIAILVSGYFGVALLSAIQNKETRDYIRGQLDGSETISNLMPQTAAEKDLFHLCSITAGITEEVIYRAYLIWAFSLFLPVWAAACIGLIVFTLVHIYQGWKELPSVFAMGALFTLIYILSGSIWPAIVTHILVDSLQNSMIWRVRQDTRSDDETLTESAVPLTKS